MIYVYDRKRGELVPKPERKTKLKMSDTEREHQRKGNFRNSDNEGSVRADDSLRQGPGVYAGK